ncbi:hypothetical protein HHI36_009097 [Cryptolaemus montrouzieri]|uniref:Uncharacterized protein n=1 Tax=Cryptolaemus montrouzieri TaxID=559131 RepID=A0ABD2MV75_9CUCU
MEGKREKANMLLHTGGNTAENSPEVASPTGSLISLVSISSNSKSHDGVFLRPGAVTRSETYKHKMLNVDVDSDFSPEGYSILASSPSPLLSDYSSSTRSGGLSHKLVKRPSIDSGIHMTGVYERSKSVKHNTSRETPKLSK